MPRSAVNEVLQDELSTRRLRQAPDEEVQKIVKHTRSAGIAVARGTLLTGFTAIAAPILDRAGLPAAAISIIGPIGSLNDEAKAAPARMLIKLTTGLSERMGWNGRSS